MTMASKNYFLTYALERVSPLFGSDQEKAAEKAEKAIQIIYETFLEFVDFSTVREASLIVDSWLWDQSKMMPAECVMKAAIEHVCDHHPECLDDWKTMKRAAKSIDELLAWPISVYKTDDEDPTDPLTVKAASESARVTNGFYQRGSLLVEQLETCSGCMMVSFQVAFLKVDDSEQCELSRTMTSVASKIIENICGDPILEEATRDVVLSEQDLTVYRMAEEILARINWHL